MITSHGAESFGAGHHDVADIDAHGGPVLVHLVSVGDVTLSATPTGAGLVLAPGEHALIVAGGTIHARIGADGRLDTTTYRGSD